MARPTHILVATDGSDPAGRAVRLAAEIAGATEADMTILTVGHELSPHELRQLMYAEGDGGAAVDTLAEELLAAAKAEAKSSGAAEVQTVTVWGDPAEVILDYARTGEVDLLVLGRRGRGRLTALLLGSVSQKLVSLAPCAVMIVP
ncbi:universal stress protein [Sphingomonas cannabina]|uniref:universal stress protein n=1 Tax=Sphingomonas cannabina TaxID=2899123 RepID=UPI001F399775|nr:universal stress protein [Sphingomonas cannabina]UIJ46223.1 universal stress protein [Sphingomonas cannabina]